MARLRRGGILEVTRKEVISVPAEMLMKNEQRASQPNPTMFLTRRDLAGTIVAALVVLVYTANAQDWWYLGSNRWAAVTIVAIGALGCPLGARLMGEKLSSIPIVLLALLGLAALVLAVVAIVTAAHWALLALAIVVVALWAGTTLRHALTPPGE